MTKFSKKIVVFLKDSIDADWSEICDDMIVKLTLFVFLKRRQRGEKKFK